MEPIVLIMAAGMGSRYGGPKQVDPVGPSGEWILDYSLYDAWRAGFRRAVIIIRPEHLDFFKEKFQKILPEDFQLSFAFQELEDIPEGFSIPEGREKPWGTAHAVYAARELIDAPFAVINADDYYGIEAYKQIYDFLKELHEEDSASYAMVAFLLKNTLSANGSVARGLCRVQEGKLLDIKETTKIYYENGKILSESESGEKTILDGDRLVSMNFWAFPQSFMEAIRSMMDEFFNEKLKKNPLKAELYLPAVVDREQKAKRAKVQVFPSQDKWMGVTYKEDKASVQEGLRKKVQAGLYPSPLWERK